MLSKRDRDYWTGAGSLREFVRWPFREKLPEELIAQRKNYPTDRKLLHRVLSRQYAGKDLPKGLQENLHALLSENTFTVCTAHQPVLFTGPMYFIYKIASTIALARRWQKQRPDIRVVPLFILGGEDHDFEEIACAHLREQDICWEAEAGGPVGRLPTQSLKTAIQQLESALAGHPLARDIRRIFEKHERYGDAMSELVHKLFGKYGLLVLQTDDADLKRSFIPQFRYELNEQPSKPAITSTQKRLKEKGYRPQAHARDINLFYMTDELRQLILPEGEGFRIKNTEMFFSREAMLEELKSRPERFSPNVVMRPLFQEHILPNLAYVGGGGELAYWMERLRQFELFNIPYPMLIRRNSALWLSPNAYQRMQKAGIRPEELFEDPQKTLKRQLLESQRSLLDLSHEKKAIAEAFSRIEQKARNIDPTLSAAVQARAQNAAKELARLEQKMLKAASRREEEQARRLQKLHAVLFPKGKLQERHDNFLPYLVEYGEEALQLLIERFNPFDKAFYVILPEEAKT